MGEPENRDIVEDFKNRLSKRRPSVLIYGDHCLDRYSIGKHEGFSREISHQPILRLRESKYIPGGAGNLAMNFAKFGVDTTILGIWGGEHGAILKEKFEEAGIDTRGMIEGLRTPTFEKFFRDRGEMVYRIDEVSENLPCSLASKLMGKLRELLSKKKFDIIFVADYDETENGVVYKGIVDWLSKTWDQRDSTLLFGTSRERIWRMKFFDWLIMNSIEFENFIEKHIGLYVHDDDIWQESMKYLTVNNFAITYGGDGVRLSWMQDESINQEFINTKSLSNVYIDSLQTPVKIDVCGCGDTFAAMFSLAICCKMHPIVAGVLGNCAARSTAKKLYTTGYPSFAEIEREFLEVYEWADSTGFRLKSNKKE